MVEVHVVVEAMKMYAVAADGAAVTVDDGNMFTVPTELAPEPTTSVSCLRGIILSVLVVTEWIGKASGLQHALKQLHDIRGRHNKEPKEEPVSL